MTTITPRFPAKKYQIIYADPPWSYNDKAAAGTHGVWRFRGMSKKERTYIVYNETDKQGLIDKIESKSVDKPWQVKVSYYKATRSLKMNRLYWFWIQHVINFFAESTGDQLTKRQVDAWLLDMFAPMEVIELPNGKVINKQKTTSEMNNYEMWEYLNKVDVYFASTFQLLLPKKQDYQDLYNQEKDSYR